MTRFLKFVPFIRFANGGNALVKVFVGLSQAQLFLEEILPHAPGLCGIGKRYE